MGGTDATRRGSDADNDDGDGSGRSARARFFGDRSAQSTPEAGWGSRWDSEGGEGTTGVEAEEGGSDLGSGRGRLVTPGALRLRVPQY